MINGENSASLCKMALFGAIRKVTLTIIFVKILLGFDISLGSVSVLQGLEIPLKSQDLGVCGLMPKIEEKNRNFFNRGQYRSIALNLSYLNMAIEGINVRIVGGSEVKDPIPW